jgi:hypothetical protein
MQRRQGYSSEIACFFRMGASDTAPHDPQWFVLFVETESHQDESVWLFLSIEVTP